MARGVGNWRAHGLVGPGKMIGAVTRKRYAAPQFKLDLFHLFFRVGLCPTRSLPFAGDMDERHASDLVSDDRMALIVWTRVHAILITTHALKLGLSEMDRRLTWRHVDTQGEPYLHQTNND